MGWSLGTLGIALLILGRVLGWVELTGLAITALALLIGSIGFALGHADLDADLELRPIRVTAGQRALAQVTIRNSTGHKSGRLQIELRVGEGFGEFTVAPLNPSEVHEEPFLLPTVRRGVIPVGPVVSVRADPLGLLRRTQVWTDELELTVHPRLVPLLELGTGFVKDLEGRARLTQPIQTSPSIRSENTRSVMTADDPLAVDGTHGDPLGPSVCRHATIARRNPRRRCSGFVRLRGRVRDCLIDRGKPR